MRRGLDYCARHGFTSLQCMDGNLYQLELLAEIEKRDGFLPLRVRIPFHLKNFMPLSMLETFDAPLLNPNCEIRNRSTVAPQSLLLMNNDFVLAQAQTLAERAIAQAGDDRQERIRWAWRLALTADRLSADFRVMPFVTRKDATIANRASYVIERARPGLQKA